MRPDGELLNQSGGRLQIVTEIQGRNEPMTKPFYSEPVIVNIITGFALSIAGLLVIKYEISDLQVVGIAIMWTGGIVLVVNTILGALGLVLESHKGGPENSREDSPVN